MGELVRALGETAHARLAPLAAASATVRGCGALWCIDVGDASRAARISARLQEGGLLATAAGGVVRLLPCATIDPAEWDRACAQVARAVEAEPVA
jgi:acetylornithine/succinyldiaminopimelate/putrescine aminotransferase